MTASRVTKYSSRHDNNSPSGKRKTPAAQRSGPRTWLQNYLALHFHVLTTTLTQLRRAPGGNLMTAMVIGIALAMPATLHVFLSKIDQLGSSWRDSARISLFLQKDLPAQALAGLQSELERWPEVGKLDYISPVQALDEFQQSAGLGDALAMLDENPLPGVLVILPAIGHQSPEAVKSLLVRLRQQPAVDQAELDMEWLMRLQRLIALVERAVFALGGLLALAVLFIIGNTIRLGIQNRHDEIEVIKLIGGSDAFVRRPFLYHGMWFGLFGGLLAWLLVNALLLALNGPVRDLAALYHSGFSLGLVDIRTTLVLLLFGPMLGLLGAWLVTGRRLRAIEPS